MARGSFFIQTFGCQMNVHDSDRIGEVLRAHGWTETDGPEGAELVLLNTCSVREKAEQKLRSEVGRLALLRRENPDMILCVAGCVAQQEGEKIAARFPEVDVVIGPDNARELPEILELQRQGSPPTVRTVFDVDAPHFLSSAPASGRTPISAFVTTMKGCDERCSFCVVPYTRGPERYRPSSEIVSEVESLVDAGAREIVLLGQTVDSFRDPSLPPPESEDPDESQFPHLLRSLAKIPGLLRLRYTSPHPRHLTPSLVRAHADLDVLARHVHMPVQSGSDRMLKRMIRRYTRAEYIERVRRLLSARDGIVLSTDVIVGFPGETKDDFEMTLSLVREIGFVSLFGFKFSPRPSTPALKLADDVPEKEKSERLARLFELVEGQSRAHLATLVGTRQKVLFESALEGRTDRNEIVHVSDGGPVGEIAEVEILRANKHSLAGRVDGTFTQKKTAARHLPLLKQV